MEENTLELRLSTAEALVLFEFAGRLNEMDDAALEKIYIDPSEMALMWNLEAALESLLAEPFRADYGDLIQAAREELRKKAGL